METLRKIMGVVVSLVIGAVMGYGISLEVHVPLWAAVVVGCSIAGLGISAVISKENRGVVGSFLFFSLLISPIAFSMEHSFGAQIILFVALFAAFTACMPGDKEIAEMEAKQQLS